VRKGIAIPCDPTDDRQVAVLYVATICPIGQRPYVYYPEFAKVADKEGFAEIATVFRETAKAETGHERRYLVLLKNIGDGSVFKRAEPVKWRCRNCGYISEGVEAPEECPPCAHPQAHYELLAENY
jgi:rubrerythrin